MLIIVLEPFKMGLLAPHNFFIYVNFFLLCDRSWSPPPIPCFLPAFPNTQYWPGTPPFDDEHFQTLSQCLTLPRSLLSLVTRLFPAVGVFQLSLISFTSNWSSYHIFLNLKTFIQKFLPTLVSEHRGTRLDVDLLRDQTETRVNLDCQSIETKILSSFARIG